MNTLLITAHPDYKNDTHFSLQLQEHFIKQFNERFDQNQLTHLNLYDAIIPRIEYGELQTIWDKLATNEKLTQAEEEMHSLSKQLLQQFKAHHRIVIVIPLHNFNIPSRLKDYLDNIMIAREVYRYTEEGSVGMMTDDYKVLLLQASGSIYTNQDRYTALDFAPQYIQGVFTEIMGFASFDSVRAQGTALLGANPESILSDAKKQLDTALLDFYSSDSPKA